MPECLQVLWKYKQKILRLTTQTHIHTGHRKLRRQKLAFKLLFSSPSPAAICQLRQRRISDLLWLYRLYQHLSNTSGTSSATVQCEPDSLDILRITALNWKVPKATTWELWQVKGSVQTRGESTLGRRPKGWVSFTFASKENPSFCFSVLGSNYFLLVLCTIFYSSWAQGRTVCQRNATWFSAGLKIQSINVHLVNKWKNKFHFRFCLFWTLHAHQNSRSKVAPCFLTKEENAHCLILGKNAVWGTPGTIMHIFCTQIHGKGSQLALKQCLLQRTEGAQGALAECD